MAAFARRMLYEKKTATLQHNNGDIYIKLHKMLTLVNNIDSVFYIVMLNVLQIEVIL